MNVNSLAGMDQTPRPDFSKRAKFLLFTLFTMVLAACGVPSEAKGQSNQQVDTAPKTINNAVDAEVATQTSEQILQDALKNSSWERLKDIAKSQIKNYVDKDWPAVYVAENSDPADTSTPQKSLFALLAETWLKGVFRQEIQNKDVETISQLNGSPQGLLTLMEQKMSVSTKGIGNTETLSHQEIGAFYVISCVKNELGKIEYFITRYSGQRALAVADKVSAGFTRPEAVKQIVLFPGNPQTDEGRAGDSVDAIVASLRSGDKDVIYREEKMDGNTLVVETFDSNGTVISTKSYGP